MSPGQGAGALGRWSAAATLVILMGCEGPSDAVRPALPQIVATCARVEGLVQVRRRDQAYWNQAGTGTLLLAGDWLRTSPGATARLEYLSGGRVEIPEKAVRVIEAAAPTEPVTAGEGPLPLEGAYAISRRPRPAEPHPRPGQAPLLLEPPLDARLTCGQGEAVKLAWEPLSGAGGYRIEVGRNLGFQPATAQATVLQPDWSFVPSSQGSYEWRVASQEGPFGTVRTFNCGKLRPLLVSPRDGASYAPSGPSRVAFTWRSAEALRYRVLVASSPDLHSDPVAERYTSGLRVDVTGLPPGQYYWGAFAEGPEGSRPIFENPRRFTIRRPPPPRPPPPPPLTVPEPLSEAQVPVEEEL